MELPYRSYAASTRQAILGHVMRFYQWAVLCGALPSNSYDGDSPQRSRGDCRGSPRIPRTVRAAGGELSGRRVRLGSVVGRAAG